MAKRMRLRNPLRIDPTRTTMLRKAFGIAIRARMESVRKAVVQLVLEDDVLGLDTHVTNATPMRQAWRFNTSAEKHKQFTRWLKEMIQQKLFTVDTTTGKPWHAKYIESAYKKGVVRAYIQTHKPELRKSLDFYEGSKEQFLRSSFSTAERLSKVELIASRTYEELSGVSSTMSQQMSRVLAEGLSNGQNPITIARRMSKTISGISRQRADRIARTEIIHAHAEGQLDAFEELGIEEVGAIVEWLTAGDNAVCELCDHLDGIVMTIDEARGLIPRHPSCRCCWAPAGVGEKATGRAWRSDTKLRRLNMSIAAERPRTTLRTARSKTRWLGKEVKPVTTNPKKRFLLR